MNNQLAHIFDNSVCLTKRQLRDYVAGHMGNEEAYALELHLNSCPFCSEAVEGLQMHPEETVAMLHEMNSDFLQEHFALHTPHVHLNSMAPAASMSAGHHNHKKKNKVQPLWRNASIAAVILLSFGLMWYLQFGREKPVELQREVAQNKPVNADQAQTNALAATPSTGSIVADERTVPASSGKDKNNRGNQQKPQLLISSGDHDADKHKMAEAGIKEDISAPAKPATEEVSGSIADASSAGMTAEKADRSRSAASATYQQPAVAAAPPMARKENTNIAAAAKKSVALKTEEPVNADEAYDNGNYTTALKQYNKDLSNSDESRRHAAMLGAASSYAKLGQKEKAIALLKKIISEGGAEKHRAKVLLRQINRSEQ
ncbi:tetratricopeptide repeat protein [Chitinophagaceae bacterium MMS25-I14]